MINKKTMKNVPLESIFFDADVYASRLAKVKMIQIYSNYSLDNPIESIFYFPVEIGFSLSKI